MVDARLFNIGKTRVTGIDLDLKYRLPVMVWGQIKLGLRGEYNIKQMQQQLDGGYVNLVNREIIAPFVGAIPRWHHYFTLYWDRGPWAVTVTENFQAGTYDVNPNPGETRLRKIGNYDVWDVSASYTGFKDWSFLLGVKNIADRNPPFTNQTATVGAPAGYDPTYTDPRGRTFWGRIKYSFH